MENEEFISITASEGTSEKTALKIFTGFQKMTAAKSFM